jgi:RecB family exonuclease
VMYNLAEFGTAARPLRASSLPRLVRCPWAAIMEAYSDGGTSGPAADTGTAVHLAIATWHTLAKKDARVAVEVMRRSVARFPLADLDSATVQFHDYTNDRRNVEAEVVACETPVTLTLPAPEEVVIIGTLDQVRRDRHGRLTVWDVKTGKPDGWDMLHEHALQLAAYMLGAGATACGIIRTQDYRRRNGPGPVFWEAPFDIHQAYELLRSVVHTVQAVRQGTVHVGPGSHCRWCPAGGLAGCLPLLREMSE